MRVTFEGNDRGLVLARSNYCFDEFARRCFLLWQRAFFGNAHVDQKSDRQRTICLALKSKERLGHTIFEDANVALLKSCDVAIVFVGGDEQKIREVGLSADHIHILSSRRLRR